MSNIHYSNTPSGPVAGVTDLTTTGNTILGDASTDTLNVGNGGLIKDASGNVGVGGTPAAKMHVFSVESRLQADSAYASFFNTAGTRRGYLQFSEGSTSLMSENAVPLVIYTNGLERMRVDSAGIVSIAGETLRVSTQKTPASATAAGVKGDIVHDTGFIYVCTATNVWKRAALATW